MSSYAKLFLDVITKKAKKNKLIMKKSQEIEGEFSSSPLDQKYDDLNDWKKEEEKYYNHLKYNHRDYAQNNFEEIKHDPKKEEMKMIVLSHKSPLNEIYPLSRFEKGGDLALKAEELVKKLNEDDAAKKKRLEEEEERKEKIEAEEELKRLEEERKQEILREERRKIDEEIACPFENELNVTVDQMNEMKVEVKKIIKKYERDQEKLTNKKNKVFIKGNSNQTAHSTIGTRPMILKPHHLNKNNNKKKKTKDNDNIVNNQISMMPMQIPMMPMQIPMIPYPNQIPLQEGFDNSNIINMGVYNTQPFEFNPAFPTQLPYIPPINQQQQQLPPIIINQPINPPPPYIPLEQPPIEQPKPKREITYKPKTMKDYKIKYENKKKPLGGLGANIGSKDWEEKHQKATNRKAYSDQVDGSNKANIKIIHHDKRLNKRVNSNENVKASYVFNEEEQIPQEELDLDESLGDNLHFNEEIDLNDNMKKGDKRTNNIHMKMKQSNTIIIANKKPLIGKNQQRKYKEENKMNILPPIKPRITQSSSESKHKKYHYYKSNTCEQQSQQPLENTELNSLLQNHHALNSKVAQIKASIYK